MGQKRILMPNDDGIQARGLKAAEASLAAVGEVLVVAPEREMSATSQAISIHFPLRVRVLDERHYAVSGTPADSVILALHQLLKARPDLVVSGINQGANLWDNVEPDSDYAAIRAHEISITPLQVDRTDYPSLNHLSHWLASLRASPAGNEEG